MSPPRCLVYYVTAHGYGHGVRSCDIINALRVADPSLVIRVVTDLPVEFLRSRLDLPVDAYRAGSFDVGMVQLDSIRVDVSQTLDRVSRLAARRADLIRQEMQFLAEQKAGAVVCDIPAIPLEAARLVGLPALAVGNFAWDWIYEDFLASDSRWADLVELFRSAYARTDLLLRLPFSEPMAAFPRRKDIPLVSIPGRPRREELASFYGIDPGLTWTLLSFTSLDLDDEAVRRMAANKGHVFLTMKPLEWKHEGFYSIDRHRFAFADVMASIDVVVTKPGYGILSEAVVNGKPLVYAERTDFREYPVLEAALKRHLRHQHIPAAELYLGNLTPYLDAISRNPPPLEPLTAGGGRIAAETILSYVDG